MAKRSIPEDLDLVAGWLANSTSTVAFTGAGISTESGIPDFRSPGGYWSRNTPVPFDEFLRDPVARYEFWRQKCEMADVFHQALPSPGHRVLAKWEAAGRLQAVITQNIDELHQQAGSQDVCELHGTAWKIVCLDCGVQFDVEPLVAQFLASDEVPSCAVCTGMLKHATVSFGQMLPPDVMRKSAALIHRANVVLAIGSSLVVEPAASLPRKARERGAKLVIINRGETALDHLADVLLNMGIGDALIALDERLPAQ